MTAARTGVQTVRAGSYIFALGGAPGAPSGSSIERATINADGTLGAWQAAGQMPPSGGRAIAVDNHLYLISYSQISWTTVEADGSLGPWQVRPGYMTELRWGGLAVAAAKGYLYALGGWNPIGRSNRYHASVERAPINADGSVGPWQETSSLPVERWGLEAVVAGDYLYALGGHTHVPSREAASDRVERALIHPDGSLGPWELMPPLMTGRTGFAAVSAGNYLFALGGWNSESTILDSVEWAGDIPGRSLSPWQATSRLTVPRVGLGAVAGDSYIYALGGFTCPNGICNQDGSHLATVEQARLDLTTPIEVRTVLLPLVGRSNSAGG